jgi:hypothetical protein
MRWLSERWSDLTISERNLFRIGWTGGAILLVIGVIGDFYGWWTKQPYLLELTSGLTAFAFGFPVAVALIRRIQKYAVNVNDAQDALDNTWQFLLALIDSYFHTASPRFPQKKSEIDRKPRKRVSLEQSSQLQLKPPDIQSRVQRAIDECNSGEDVHDVTMNLRQELEQDIRFPVPGMHNLAAALWHRDVPKLTGMGDGYKIAIFAPSAQEAWDAVSQRLTCAHNLIDLNYESDDHDEVLEFCQELKRFYEHLEKVLLFAEMVINFAYGFANRPGRPVSPS